MNTIDVMNSKTAAFYGVFNISLFKKKLKTQTQLLKNHSSKRMKQENIFL